VRHLVDSGRKRIAMICGAAGNGDAAARLQGYRAALDEAGIERRHEWEMSGDFLERSGFTAAERLLRLSPRPDAIFAANDSMAIGAMSALQAAGCRVPDDVAVAGFDDIPISRYMSPPLTTIRIDIAGLGGRAVRALVRAVGSKNAHERRQETLPAELVVRESCGARHAATAGNGR